MSHTISHAELLEELVQLRKDLKTADNAFIIYMRDFQADVNRLEFVKDAHVEVCKKVVALSEKYESISGQFEDTFMQRRRCWLFSRNEKAPTSKKENGQASGLERYVIRPMGEISNTDTDGKKLDLEGRREKQAK
jgi:hypothetical protein